MFKTDKESLEELSFRFTESDVARFYQLLGLIKKRNLSSLPEEEISRLERGLSEIGRLKLDKKIYAFSVEDTYAARNSVRGGNSGTGVELYVRQGDKLGDYIANPDRDWVLKVKEVLPGLMKDRVTKIYTGQIQKSSSFLGLPQECDEDDPIYRNKLSNGDIQEFKLSGIDVICLEVLI